MPNRTKFTQAAVDNLKPPADGRATYWDGQFPGFGLRVSAPRPGSRYGRKTWIAMGRVDGKAVMVTLGTMAQIPKVEKAREAARAAILKMRAGTKPLDEHRAERERRQAEAAAAKAAAREAVEGRFDAVAERFLRERGQAEGWSPKYAAEVRRILAHDVLPRWGERPICEITTDDVKALLWTKAGKRERRRKGAEGGAAKQANRTLTRLGTLFRWALRASLIAVDPTLGIDPLVKERARDRVLCGDEKGHKNDDELVWFWRGTERTGWPYAAIFRLMLLTAQREAEIAGMRWSEIDLDRGIWTLPRERTKSDRSHIVHLSELACEILRATPRVGDLVLPSRAGTVISSFAKPKERLDAAMAAQAGGDPIAPFVLHDLRRTAATLMVRLGIASDVADRILNHAAGNRQGTVKDVYGRYEFLQERKAAMDALGRFVTALVRPGGTGNVVEISRARA
jgi:integrase